MYILQTTAVVLVSYLVVLVYSKVRAHINKSRPRSKDLKFEGSQRTSDVSNSRLALDYDSADLSAQAKNNQDSLALTMYKTLYYKLHNIEQYPEILPECRQLLLSLLSVTLTDAFEEPETSILSVQVFSRDSLHIFLKEKDVDVTSRWEAYLARRKAGSPREMFSNQTEARWWLKQAAPVKYVDGSWLGHINKISTPFKYRNITKNAWQVMSEELGDGDLKKNHVHVYRNLMKDIDAGLPSADSKDFIHARHELSEARCWRAAMAQMLISLFPHDFLPEVLGFNLAYESLPLHLLKTIKELRELRLNPYYFELHVSIDNADSGHAAMALATVTEYIQLTEATEGIEAAHLVWKRIQAGYILAERLPTTPESPSLKTNATKPFPRNETEALLVKIFSAKSLVAHKIHCNSRLRIGRRFLVDWLEPIAFSNTQWQKEFLHDLSNCSPWVIKGNSEKSRLMKELSWEGRMFGGFTEAEVDIVKHWIDELGNPMQAQHLDASAYLEFTKREDIESASDEQDVMIDYPVTTCPYRSTFLSVPANYMKPGIDTALSLNPQNLTITNFLPLWFTSITLLESLPSLPIRAADTFGSAIIRILRAQNGFDIEGTGVAGMDEIRRTHYGSSIGLVELGVEMCHRAGITAPSTIREAAALGSAGTVAFVKWMVRLSMQWLTHRDMLVGMAWAFMELHHLVADIGGDGAMLSECRRHILRAIVAREKKGLEVCKREIEDVKQRENDFQRGLNVARRAIVACCKM